MELRTKVITGASWTVFYQVTNQVLSIGVMIVLARLLNPEDFGTVALSDVFVVFAYLFADLGMGPAIIQRKEIDDSYLSTSFWVSLITGFGLTLLLCAASPFVASFYNRGILKSIIIVSSTTFIFGAFTSVHRTILTRKLEFNKIAYINITSRVISAMASVGIAFLGLGVWSLVLGAIISQILVTPLIWHLEKWRPRLLFSKKCFMDMFGFSSYLLAFNFFNYFFRNSDSLIIGRVLGVEILGYYSLAYGLMLKPLQYVSWSVGNVLFPAFSRLQEDIERVRLAYIRVVRSISLLTFPMMLGLIVVSREFVLTFYGAKWAPVVIPLQLLSIIGAIQSIGTTVGILFNSQGKSDLQLKWGVFASTTYVAAFFIGIHWGLIGLILMYMGVCFIIWPVSHYISNQIIGLDMKTFFRSMFPATTASISMFTTLILLKYIFLRTLHLESYFLLMVLVPVGVVLYATFLQIFFKVPEVEELKNFLRGIITSRLIPAFKRV